jgi:hypothetical protein
MQVVSATDKELPHCANPYTDKELPTLEKERKDRAEPKWTNPTILKSFPFFALPNRKVLIRECDEDNLPNDLSDNVEPSSV